LKNSGSSFYCYQLKIRLGVAVCILVFHCSRTSPWILCCLLSLKWN